MTKNNILRAFMAIAIDGVNDSRPQVESVHDAAGQRVSGMRRGVNIVRMSNGETRKIVVK